MACNHPSAAGRRRADVKPVRHARTYDAPINLAVLALAAAHFDAPPEVVVGDAALPAAGGLLRPGGFHRPEGDECRAFPADRPELPSGWSGREPGAPR